jgi:hypothetical protein
MKMWVKKKNHLGIINSQIEDVAECGQAVQPLATVVQRSRQIETNDCRLA